MAESAAAAGGKLKVFISYSRKDASGFADELVAGLEVAGFAPFLDRHDIAPGENWEVRLGRLIQEADTVVFVVSPEAVRSERCIWEVEKTVELSKRLLPLIFKPVPDADIPTKLARLQFIRFDIGPGFARPLVQLAEALRQDIEWIREHTRLGDMAARWQSRGQPESLLVRGTDLEACQSWLKQRKASAPEVSDLVQAFLNASSEAETARTRKERQQLEDMARAQARTACAQRVTTWALVAVAAAVALGIGIVSWEYKTNLDLQTSLGARQQQLDHAQASLDANKLELQHKGANL
jgi:TIR domain